MKCVAAAVATLASDAFNEACIAADQLRWAANDVADPEAGAAEAKEYQVCYDRLEVALIRAAQAIDFIRAAATAHNPNKG